MENSSFSSFVETNIINKFSQDIANVTNVLSEYVTNIPVERFSAPINFVVKYDMKNCELTISSTAHKDSQVLLIKSEYAYCEAVFTRAFENFFGMSDKSISKITKTEPSIDDIIKNKNNYITYEFNIDSIIKSNKEFLTK